jgi:hypothetical protein
MVCAFSFPISILLVCNSYYSEGAEKFEEDLSMTVLYLFTNEIISFIGIFGLNGIRLKKPSYFWPGIVLSVSYGLCQDESCNSLS